jgi:DNA-binding response OmpR family regulator
MESPNDRSAVLQGAHVLVVEDDFLISMELTSVLTEAGADVVGPSRTIADAMARVDHGPVSAAILDVRIGANHVAPLARELHQRAIPFLFYTGQGNDDPVRREWPQSKVIAKPAHPRTLVAAVANLLKEPRGHSAPSQAH